MLQVLRAVRDRARRLKNSIAWSVRKRRVARQIAPVVDHPSKDRLNGATLFFVPYAGVTPMFAQACVVARTLKERGHRVVFARCWRLFERCPVIDMHLLPFDASEEAKLEKLPALRGQFADDAPAVWFRGGGPAGPRHT